MSESAWDHVTVIRKRGVPQNSNQKVGTPVASTKVSVSNEKKTTQLNKNKERLDPRLAKRIEEESEEFHVKRIGLSLSQVIKKARNEKGLTQKELAVRVNEKQSVINDCESGKLPVTGAQELLHKMERVLGVYLTGKSIGMPLRAKGSASKS